MVPVLVKDHTRKLADGFCEGFYYVVTHNNLGYRCGYVCIPKGHPWHGQEYDDLEGVSVHGGLTFSGADDSTTDINFKDSWWIGFDCAHAYDAPDLSLLPEKSAERGFYDRYPPTGEIRTTEYVVAECESLCKQAFAALPDSYFSSARPDSGPLLFPEPK